MPKTISVARDTLVSRVHTQLQNDALQAAGKGKVLSKAEQEKLDAGVLLDAARDLRREGATVVRLDAWVDAAMTRVTAALDKADAPGRGHGKISLVEARNASLTYNDVGPRIAKGFEVLTGKSLETTGAADPALASAVAALLVDKKFSVLEGLGSREPSKWASAKMEAALQSWGGEADITSSGSLVVGGKTVTVATSAVFGRDKTTELIGVFDKEGRTLGRAFIERLDSTWELSFRAAKDDGKPGDVLAQANTPKAPEAWVADLTTVLSKKHDDGEDFGVRINRSALPPALQAMAAFMDRNTPDGTGFEKIAFEGKTVYAIHDYSCVSSVAVYGESGEKLCDFVS